MFCENCGSPIPDGQQFCQNCGAPVNQQNNGYSQNVNGSDNTVFSMPNSGVNYNPVQQNETPGLGKYLGWLILSGLPGLIGLVISIVFACSSDNKNRANFFRAALICRAISYVVVIIAWVIIAVLGASVFAFADMPFYDFEYDSFMQIMPLLSF